MDPQPKALRPYVILTTAFVLFGAMAGFALFLQQRTASPVEVPVLDDATIDAVVTRPMPSPASMDAATRDRVAAALKVLTTDPAAPARRSAGESLLELGTAAVPPILDALHRIALASSAFQETEARVRLVASDTVLSKIRLAATPGSPAAPYRRAPDAAWCLRRVKSWFLWWDAYVADHPEWR